MRQKNNSLTLVRLSVITIILGLATLSGCEDLTTGCIYCNVLSPWTNGDTQHMCYATEYDCERETGDDCYKCEL